MVQYRYAKSSEGRVVDASELAKARRDATWKFICFGCNRPLVAKVHGQHKTAHFAHAADATCSDETYLHHLGKKVFVEEFTKCRAEGLPFEIELSYPQFCRKYEDDVGWPCQMSTIQVKTHNLASIFNDIQEETRDGSFIPDLMLIDTDRTHTKVYVEIAVTHFLSEKKERSGHRIIEIPLESEEDVSKIRSHRLTEKNCRFVHFSTEAQSVTDSECSCQNCPAYGLIVWDSGKAVLEKSTLGGIIAKRRRNQEKILYFRLTSVERHGRTYLPPPGDAFRNAVLQARKDGFALRNCYLCRYQGANFNGDPSRPIYCKYLKIRCGSNHAVECHAFKLTTSSPDDMPRM